MSGQEVPLIGGASPLQLGLSTSLTEALWAWQRQWEHQWGALDEAPQDQDEYATWKTEGHALVDRPRDELSYHRYDVVADF